MNIPNFLTIIRIIIVPLIVILLLQHAYIYAFITFIIAGITDGLDGFLARILRQRTLLGAYLDPLADKALIITSVITLSVMGFIPGWVAVIVIARDVIILIGIAVLFVMSVPVEIDPSFVSKVTTSIQIVTVLVVLAVKCFMPETYEHPAIVMMFWATAVLTVISGIHYIVRGIKLINKTV